MPTPQLPPGMRLCPFCGNGTPRKLKACRHCNHVLPGEHETAKGFFWLIVLVVFAYFAKNSLEDFFQLIRGIFR